jgi:anthranilate synthase component 1
MPDPEIQLQPSYAEFQALSQKGNLIPVWAELTADYETPLSAFEKIADGAPRFLLESAEMTSHAGRYSFLGAHPRATLSARGKSMRIVESPAAPGAQPNVREFETQTDPLRELENYMRQFRVVSNNRLPVFAGGAVGYLGYDMVRFFEPTVSAPPPDALGIPDMIFLIADTLVIFDHRYRTLQVVAHVLMDDFADAATAYASAREKILGLIRRLEQPLHVRPMPAASTPAGDKLPMPPSNTSREEFCRMVLEGKEFIKAGDIFQFVPSQRFSAPYSGRPIDLYRALRHVNPSPYMFCLDFAEGFSLVGSSPEVHVRAINGKIEIRPIAGTRWRGKTAEEDDSLAADLLRDEKERAEHLMLVDLARNDVGRIADYGSVEVDDLMIIERYSHVMHIVSNVKGRLAPGRSAYDVMQATFPAGTVSGSPKVRAMQIINQLEKNKRCAYAGAVGYFGFDGNLDSCIALRTCVLKDGKAHVQAGAGVVADSDPEYEYNETVSKAAGMIRAIERAKSLA